MTALIVAAGVFYGLAGKFRVEIYLNRNASAADLRDDLCLGRHRARLHAAVLAIVWPFWHPLRLGA